MALTSGTSKPRRKDPKHYGINAHGTHPMSLAERMTLAGSTATAFNRRKGQTHHVSKAARQRGQRRLQIAKKKGWIAQDAKKLPVYLLTQKERAFFQGLDLLPHKGKARASSKLPKLSYRYKPGEVSTFANTASSTPSGERIWRKGDPKPGTAQTGLGGASGGSPAKSNTLAPGSTVGKTESSIKPLAVFRTMQRAGVPQAARVPLGNQQRPRRAPERSAQRAAAVRKRMVSYMTRA